MYYLLLFTVLFYFVYLHLLFIYPICSPYLFVVICFQFLDICFYFYFCFCFCYFCFCSFLLLFLSLVFVFVFVFPFYPLQFACACTRPVPPVPPRRCRAAPCRLFPHLIVPPVATAPPCRRRCQPPHAVVQAHAPCLCPSAPATFALYNVPCHSRRRAAACHIAQRLASASATFLYQCTCYMVVRPK